MDFIEKSTERIQLHDTLPEHSSNTPIEIEGHESKKYLEYNKSEPSQNNAIMEEQANFIKAITNGATVLRTDGATVGAFYLHHEAGEVTPAGVADHRAGAGLCR